MASPAFGTAGTQLQGSASTMNVDVPDSVAAGDIVVVTAFIDTSVTVTGLATDFVQAPDSPVAVEGGANHRLYVMWKRATGADSTAGTYDFTLSASVYRNAQAIRYTGAISSGDPWDVTNAATIDTSGSGTSPAVSDTTTVADTLLVWASTNWAGGTWTPPAGFTERRDTGDGVCTVADLAQAAAGATGSITGTCTGTDKRAAWLGALKSEAAITESSAYSPARLPGRIGPDGDVFLPRPRFDVSSTAEPVSVDADSAILVLSGIDATLQGSGTGSVTADVAALTFSGVDPVLAGSGATSITADIAVLVLSGVDVAASAASTATADSAVLAFIGVTPTLAGSGSATITADVATLVLSGVDVAASTGATNIDADTAALTLIGVTPTLIATGAGAITADTVTLTFTGITPILAGTGTISMIADVAILVFQGVDVGAFVGQQVTPDDRTHLIPAVSRTNEIPAVPRALEVTADSRTVTVPVD
jgi:hypothetical protein